jgi:hypothetical protein
MKKIFNKIFGKFFQRIKYNRERKKIKKLYSYYVWMETAYPKYEEFKNNYELRVKKGDMSNELRDSYERYFANFWKLHDLKYNNALNK